MSTSQVTNTQLAGVGALPPEHKSTPMDLAIELSYRSGLTLTRATREFRWRYLQRVLDANGGNQSRTARALCIHRNTLSREIAVARANDFPIRCRAWGRYYDRIIAPVTNPRFKKHPVSVGKGYLGNRVSKN